MENRGSKASSIHHPEWQYVDDFFDDESLMSMRHDIEDEID